MQIVAERLTIASLGARGDGVALTPMGPVYVPFALPGETVTVEIAGERARLIAVETPSPARRAQVSPYFTRCGGCVAQHMDENCYRRWKRGIVTDALARAAIGAPFDDLVDAHGDGRRRVVFHARKIDGEVRIGFMAAKSHELVPIDRCPVLAPSLTEAPAIALSLARHLGRKPLDIQLTATTSGLDVDIRGHGPAGDRLQRALVEIASALDLARLSLHGEVLVERRPPAVMMGRALVVPPPGGFLQPTAKGEETLAALVRHGCGPAKRVADLFAGCGPFALRLAERTEVHAVDGDGAALAALDRAARHTPGLRRMTTERRDLFRRALLPPELERFDAVVFDPPRLGAEAVARQIAASTVPVVVAVSCDAGTFARDARTLIAGGFTPIRITPVDQFRYAHHVEIVGVFERGSGAKRSR